MSEQPHRCGHPTCYESTKTTTIYKKHTDKIERGWIPICGSHLTQDDLENSKVTVIKSSVGNQAAQEANAEIVKGLQQ